MCSTIRCVLFRGAAFCAAMALGLSGLAAGDSLPLVPEAKDYKLLYDLDLSKLSHDIVYDVDNSASLKGKSFDRVAYLLELDSTYVYVSFAAITNDLSKVGIPSLASGACFQRKIEKMNVFTNSSSIVSGTGLDSGNIEFWPNNYSAVNEKKIPNASDSAFDFGDQKCAPVDGYGCMQIHNFAAKQTLFAINHWSASGNADLGIGNRPNEANADWTFAGNAGSYASKRLRVLVHEGSFVPPVKLAVKDPLPQIQDANGYQLLYDLDLSNLGSHIDYGVDNSGKVGSSFKRVAYLLQLDDNYVFVSMDAFSNDPKKLGVPTAESGASFQAKVANMNVSSNVNGLATGSNIQTGNIEFWPNNYGQTNGSGIPGASDATFDFGDQPGDPLDGYGCMQVHNYGAKQTVFSINNWKCVPDLGIGNAPGENSDWTFSANGGSYEFKHLKVFVK